MKTSESIKEIAGALAKARKAFKPILKDKTATVKSDKGSYKFNFADLSSVMDAVTDALSDNGLAVVQAVSTDTGGVTVETRLVHASGEWMEAAITMRADASRPQNIGSAATYARRYGLSGMLGVASEEDDDANAAEGNEATITPRQNGAPMSRPEAVKAKVQQQTQEAMKSPAFRKQEALNDLKKLGLDVRAEVAHAIGRTIPADAEIKITEPELAKLEGHVTLRKAEHNSQRNAAH